MNPAAIILAIASLVGAIGYLVRSLKEPKKDDRKD
jgi:hypothetical protein